MAVVAFNSGVANFRPCYQHVEFINETQSSAKTDSLHGDQETHEFLWNVHRAHTTNIFEIIYISSYGTETNDTNYTF